MSKKRVWILSIIGGVVLVILLTGVLLNRNLNILLNKALITSFNQSSLSDMYELEFEGLHSNIFNRSITVNKVRFFRKENLPPEYSYINSKINLTTDKIELSNVRLLQLLTKKQLSIRKLEIRNPEIIIEVLGSNTIFFPIQISPNSENTQNIVTTKINEYHLDILELTNANIHGVNNFLNREYFIHNLQISLHDFKFDAAEGNNTISNAKVELQIDSLNGKMFGNQIRNFNVSAYHINLDSFTLKNYIDRSIYDFSNVETSFRKLSFLTADSALQCKLDSMHYNYSKGLLYLRNIELIPNVSDEEIQRKHKYETSSVTGSVSEMDVSGIRLKSFINYSELKADSIRVQGVDLKIYKDKTKPLNTTRIADLFPQLLMNVKIPVDIKRLVAKDIDILSKEKMPDSKILEVQVNDIDAQVYNISNQYPDSSITITGNGVIENVVPFDATLIYDYNKTHFTFNVNTSSFDITKINPLISKIAPVTLDSGIVDRLYMRGHGYKNYATGTLGFEYHGLQISMLLEDKSNWFNSVASLAANSFIKGNNPVNEKKPPFISTFSIERNMYRRSINMMMLSIAAGIKESLVFNRSSKQQFKKVKEVIKDITSE
ncbi:MAG: hypothetical protein IPG60_04445 [Bacteroidetes bacterium]|nr:hypothetical protein [Bacteroidota bacterium]MBP7398702.1 hypothetical protein [Chitinophagales bacterium]MBK7108959.1 hypothetical protein [Bacteroidota bacterium]MBK8488716.1 hypothetical protein [Bacteroidota bacterium]MBK8681528.1 hypothetical protein [Bacteroidota bacterium]